MPTTNNGFHSKCGYLYGTRSHINAHAAWGGGITTVSIKTERHKTIRPKRQLFSSSGRNWWKLFRMPLYGPMCDAYAFVMADRMCRRRARDPTWRGRRQHPCDHYNLSHGPDRTIDSFRPSIFLRAIFCAPNAMLEIYFLSRVPATIGAAILLFSQ